MVPDPFPHGPAGQEHDGLGHPGRGKFRLTGFIEQQFWAEYFQSQGKNFLSQIISGLYKNFLAMSL